jgi:hypothetical protein
LLRFKLRSTDSLRNNVTTPTPGNLGLKTCKDLISQQAKLSKILISKCTGIVIGE